MPDTPPDHTADHLAYHTGFSPADFEAGYNLRARRPDFEDTVIRVWQDSSAAARQSLDCRLDVRYGAGERQLLDVFGCGDATAPTLVFFHAATGKVATNRSTAFLPRPL